MGSTSPSGNSRRRSRRPRTGMSNTARPTPAPGQTRKERSSLSEPRASGPYAAQRMAKDTEKLIRQLSLISFLMAERRPVTALEIKREVEGYSGMNDDAFARRFYADRAELESL